jgi:hypothetical protein
MKPMRGVRKTCLLVWLLAGALPVVADDLNVVAKRSYRPYKPVEVTSWVYDAPRPIRAWTVAVDLNAEGLQWVTTPRGGGNEAFETACQTTLEFAEQYQVQVALNASPFSPFRKQSGEPMDVVGLGAADGDVYSQPDKRFGGLVFDAVGHPRILPAPIDVTRVGAIDDAVGGFHVLVRGGENRVAVIEPLVSESFANVNPRSAVGLSKDRRTLWLIAVDGRVKGRSEGMTLRELADLGARLGCHDLLNLDGGGSTTLVVQDPASGSYRVVNQPVGRGAPDTLRLVANNVGLRVPRGKQTPGP